MPTGLQPKTNQVAGWGQAMHCFYTFCKHQVFECKFCFTANSSRRRHVRLLPTSLFAYFYARRFYASNMLAQVKHLPPGKSQACFVPLFNQSKQMARIVCLSVHLFASHSSWGDLVFVYTRAAGFIGSARVKVTHKLLVSAHANWWIVCLQFEVILPVC